MPVIKVGCRVVGGARLVVMDLVEDAEIGCPRLEQTAVLELAGPDNERDPPIFTTVDAAHLDQWWDAHQGTDLVARGLVFRKGEDPGLSDPPEPVPASVPIWQFAWQAAAEGFITMPEARAWSGRGILPATLETKLAEVVADPNERDGLAMQLESLTTVVRADPLLGTLGALFGKDGPALDEFFRAAEQRGAKAA